MFNRALVRQDGMIREMRAGDGLAANYAPYDLTTDANVALTAGMIASGLILRDNMTANRTDTTPTGAELAAAFSGMDIGDTFSFKVLCLDIIQSVILVGGTGVTVRGIATVPNNTATEFVLLKTGAATFDLIAVP